MFKKYRAASECTLRVGDVDGVAAVVLVGVADVVLNEGNSGSAWRICAVS